MAGHIAHIPTPTIAYAGELQPPPPQVDEFIDLIVRNPGAMAAALDLVTTEPVPADRIAGFLDKPPEVRDARVTALAAASGFLASTVSGEFRYDRPTEREISKDGILKDLELRHRATAGSPDRQAELTRKIRARRLAIFAGRLADSNGADFKAA